VFGQFGENFTVEGLSDEEVCIGDRYRIGSALFEVTQPREQCSAGDAGHRHRFAKRGIGRYRMPNSRLNSATSAVNVVRIVSIACLRVLA
jgi:MOSC domain